VNTGLVAAEVSSLVVPDRLPAATRKILSISGSDDPSAPPSDVPLGRALADLGVHREPLGARMVRDITGIQGSGVWVESSARMWLGEMPVALASERVTVEFCRRARDRRTKRITAKGALCRITPMVKVKFIVIPNEFVFHVPASYWASSPG